MKHLLVIDNDTLFREQLAERLEARGYRVTALAGITETTACLETLSGVDGALVDMRLDDGQGLDLIAPLLQRTPAPDTPQQPPTP